MMTGDAVRWTNVARDWDTPHHDKLTHRVTDVHVYRIPCDAWIACHPLYRAWIGDESTQLTVTDEPVDCMACIAAERAL